MSNKDIWIIFTKSKALEGCTIDIDGCEFYFAEVFIPSDNSINIINCLEDAISKTKQVLLENKLELSDISKCIRYVEQEWKTHSELNNKTRKMAEFSLKTGVIKLSSFRSEEIQDEYCYSIQTNEL